MTQRLAARAGQVTPEMEQVARSENVDPATIAHGVASGKIVIPRNNRRRAMSVIGIGQGLRTKVNALIGTSSDQDDIEVEAGKVRMAIVAGADMLMDLSTGGRITPVLHQTLAVSTVPVGTTPIYQAALEAIEKRGGIVFMTADDIFSVIERQAAAGVDFMALHCGFTRSVITRLKRQGRVTDIVSRGGAFLTCWMLHHEQENPLYEQYDRLLEMARRYDVTLSLSDGIRPGCIADSLDRAQVQGTIVIGELVERAWDAGVQVMVEGPGHIPLDEIEPTLVLQKQLCRNAPYFMLGPLATDTGAGHDHITAAIGATVATAAGANAICYVTPAEHLGLPTSEDVRDGMAATRIAVHAGDLAKGHSWAWERELSMAQARRAGDRERMRSLALDPDRVDALAPRRDAVVPGEVAEQLSARKLLAQYLEAE